MSDFVDPADLMTEMNRKERKEVPGGGTGKAAETKGVKNTNKMTKKVKHLLNHSVFCCTDDLGQ